MELPNLSTDNSKSKNNPVEETFSLPVCKEIVADKNPVKYPTNYTETLIHLFKANVGLGIFAMGNVFKNSGILLGAILVPFLGLVCLHCEHLLVNTSEYIKKSLKLSQNPDFALTAEMCFATGPLKLQFISPYIKKIVNILLCLTQLNFCFVYFVFINNSVKQIVDLHYPEYGAYLHQALVFVPIILCGVVRNIKYLTPLSVIGNICILYGVVIILYYSCLSPFAQVEIVASMHQLPLVLGSILYSFEGIGLVLPLRNEMKNPQQFSQPFGVLNVGLTGAIVLFWLMGICTYLRYGVQVLENVIFNLPSDELLAESVRFVVPLGVLLSCSLQFYILIKILFPIIKKRFGLFTRPVLTEVVFRLVFILIMSMLEQIFPSLSLFITLAGALCTITLTIIIPPFLDFMVKSSSSHITFWVLTKNSLIIALGVFGCISGFYQNIVYISDFLMQRFGWGQYFNKF